MNTIIPGKFTGIIQLAFSDTAALQSLQSQVLSYFPNHQPIGKLHVTLLHQSYPKKYGSGKSRGDKLLKGLYKEGGQFSIQPPMIQLDDVYVASDGSRESTYVTIQEQGLLMTIRDQILQAADIPLDALGITEEEPNPEGRIFHVSLTNLTGNGGDSIAYPNLASDKRLFNVSEVM